MIEKIAYSAIYASRLEWVLRKCGVERLCFTGIVTNGGVASRVRDAHVREFGCTMIADGCAAFSDTIHRAAIEGLRPLATITTIDDVMRLLAQADRSWARGRPGAPAGRARFSVQPGSDVSGALRKRLRYRRATPPSGT